MFLGVFWIVFREMFGGIYGGKYRCRYGVILRGIIVVYKSRVFNAKFIKFRKQDLVVWFCPTVSSRLPYSLG